MDHLFSTVALLVFAALVTESRATVVFKEIKWHPPCTDRTLEFSTTGKSGTVMHRFRLGPTLTLFVKYNDLRVAYWSGHTLKWDLYEEHVFFDQQSILLKEMLAKPALKRVEISLVYTFDPSVKTSVFYLYIDGVLVSICRDGAVTYISASELDPAIISAAKDFVQGSAVGLLKEKATVLDSRWNDVCQGLESGKNETDVYALTYDPVKETVACSIASRVQWRHEVSFEENVSVTVEKSYNLHRRLFMTVGRASPGPHTYFSCNITSPNGMVAIQELQLTLLQSTRRPTTPRVELSSAPTRATSNYVTGIGETTIDDDGSHGSRSSASRAGAISGAILAVFAICASVGLIAFRKKILSVGARFRKVPTGARTRLS